MKKNAIRSYGPHAPGLHTVAAIRDIGTGHEVTTSCGESFRVSQPLSDVIQTDGGNFCRACCE